LPDFLLVGRQHGLDLVEGFLAHGRDLLKGPLSTTTLAELAHLPSCIIADRLDLVLLLARQAESGLDFGPRESLGPGLLEFDLLEPFDLLRLENATHRCKGFFRTGTRQFLRLGAALFLA